MNYNKMLEWIGTHHVGISSRTMWCALMGIANNETPTYYGFDFPRDADDFSRCYDLVTFCEVEKEELQKVVEAFPYYKPIIDEWDNLVAAYLDKSGCSRSVFQIIDSRRDEIMKLKGYEKQGDGYWILKKKR